MGEDQATWNPLVTVWATYTKQINTMRIQTGHRPRQINRRPLRERRLVIRQLRHARPNLFIRRSQQPTKDVQSKANQHSWRTPSSRTSDSPENLEDLVNLGVPGEERLPHRHFRKDTPDGPHVDRGAVVPRAKEDFRGPVPECDDLQGESVGKWEDGRGGKAYFVGVCSKGDTKGSSETEICGRGDQI